MLHVLDISLNRQGGVLYVLTANNSIYSVHWNQPSSALLLFRFNAQAQSLSMDWLNYELYVAMVDQVCDPRLRLVY